MRPSVANPSKPWKLALHTFTAFMALSFAVKGVYFLVGDDPTFVLIRYPRADDLSGYVTLAMAVAFAFTVLVWGFYSAASRLLPTRPAALPEVTHPLFDDALVAMSVGLLLWLLWDRGMDVAMKVQTGSILYRNIPVRGSDFESGAYGVTSFFSQVRNGLFIALLSYAVLHRRYLLCAICTAYFMLFAIVSDGSRFTLLACIAILPVAVYLTWFRKDSHRNIASTSVYVIVLLLPFAVAPLLLLRSQGSVGEYVDSSTAFVHAALYTFDGLDHLVNYLYLLPIDWTAHRALQEAWQFLPRALYHDKPYIYGLLSLQELLYPHTIGGGGRYLLLNHYPLSNVVMAIDACGPIGFLVHSAGTGLLLAWLDSLLHRRTTVALAFLLAYLTSSYHVVRVGLQNYIIAAIAPYLIPLGLFSIALYFGRLRTVRRTPSPVVAPACAPTANNAN